jgi:alkaline phosphatase
MKTYLLISFALIFAFLYGSCSQPETELRTPKNVIIFIGDGMGYNHVDAASIYFSGETGKLIFEGHEWLKVAQASYPAIVKTEPEKVYATGYNPRAAWSDTAYLKRDYTDSGAAGTALSTGFKTYDGAIGIGVDSDTLMNATQLAKEIGKSAGVVSSVQLSHATPAAFSANNESRRNYDQIARQMILESKLDVIIGCGHPNFNNNGLPAEMDYKYVVLNNKTYELADVNGDGNPDPWRLATDINDFAEIAAGNNLPERLLGIPKVHTTLQQSRDGSELILPFAQPKTPEIPTLELMTMAAVHVLNQNPDGFFLMVEGGAIDWAGHDNHSGRMIEEMEDFVNAVTAVVKWVETYSSWDETLVVVTSDHETGMLWGEPDGNNVLTSVKNNGKGQLPGMKWYSGDHTNALVPVYARGRGSQMYSFLADEIDPVKGPFIQNTEIAKAVFLLWEK